jgi:hypothetical protein
MLHDKTAHKNNWLSDNRLKLCILNASVFLFIQSGIASAAETIVQEGFEAGVVPPDNWTRVQNNPSQTWKISAVGTPHTGTHFADVEYDPTLVNQDEILLSPEFKAASATVSLYSMGSVYWCRDTYNNCDLEIWIVKGAWDGGTDDDIYVGKADDTWTNNFLWSKSTYNLDSLLPNSPIRIGFRYKGNDGAQVGLDDIEIRYTEPKFPWPMFVPATTHSLHVK